MTHSTISEGFFLVVVESHSNQSLDIESCYTYYGVVVFRNGLNKVLFILEISPPGDSKSIMSQSFSLLGRFIEGRGVGSRYFFYRSGTVMFLN